MGAVTGAEGKAGKAEKAGKAGKAGKTGKTGRGARKRDGNNARASAAGKSAIINAREVALRALADIEINKAYAGVAADRALRAAGAREGDGREAAFARELTIGVVKWKSALDEEIMALSTVKRERISTHIMCVLRMGIYQIRHMSGTPPRAACDEAVKLAKKYGNAGAARFVNAMLRAVSRNATSLDESLDETLDKTLDEAPSIRTPARHDSERIIASYPAWLAKRWLDRYGYAEAVALMEALNGRPILAIRPNRLKTTVEEAKRALESEGFIVEYGAVSPNALRIVNPRGFAKSRAFLTGLFTVQDESSMLCAPVLGAKAGEVVLDMCAAPGGKTTHISELTDGGCRVVACDIHASKLTRIEENCARLGIASVKTVAADATSPDAAKILVEAAGGLFDRVLLDAPCTGFGILRRKPDIKWNRQDGDIKRLAAVQSGLLAAAAALVKPGGTLVYSVCTTEPEEGELQTEAFLSNNQDFYGDNIIKYLPPTPPFAELCRPSAYAARVSPVHHGSDGFYFARFVKKTRGGLGAESDAWAGADPDARVGGRA